MSPASSLAHAFRAARVKSDFKNAVTEASRAQNEEPLVLSQGVHTYHQTCRITQFIVKQGRSRVNHNTLLSPWGFGQGMKECFAVSQGQSALKCDPGRGKGG